MKRVGNLYNNTFSRGALYDAYLTARTGKRNRRACFEFEKNLHINLDKLYNELNNDTYKPAKYYQFYVYEPKKRLISAPSFRDRIVQHAIYKSIYQHFNKRFIDQSFGCRTDKGTHKAAEYAHKCLQHCNEDEYILQLDIRKYYYSINTDILVNLIKEVIKDSRLVEVISLFIDCDIGVPIGNLLSQLFDLIYLNKLDHFIKRNLKVKYYARYVDDFILIGITKEEADSFQIQIENFLKTELHLELSKVIKCKVKRGINFVGYRAWKERRFIRKRSLYIFRKAVSDNKLESVVSCLGHAKRTASYRYMLNYIRENNYELYSKLPKSVR